MGRIKQFTLRFDTGIPAEKEMMEYLKTRSEQLGISRNTFLIQLLQRDMEQGSTLEALGLDLDAVIEKIVSEVAEQLSGMMTAAQAVGMEAAVRDGTCDVNRRSLVTAGGEILSDDAMDFLSVF